MTWPRVTSVPFYKIIINSANERKRMFTSPCKITCNSILIVTAIWSFGTIEGSHRVREYLQIWYLTAKAQLALHCNPYSHKSKLVQDIGILLAVAIMLEIYNYNSCLVHIYMLLVHVVPLSFETNSWLAVCNVALNIPWIEFYVYTCTALCQKSFFDAPVITDVTLLPNCNHWSFSV